MEKMDLKQIDLKKAPYRGILKEIALENNTSQQSIWNAVYIHNNQRILTVLRDKMKARQKAHKQNSDRKNILISEIEQLAKAI